MTGNDRFNIDELLAQRFGADAPAEAPSWILPAVQDRINRTQQRGGRMPTIVGGLLAAAAVVVLAVATAVFVPPLLNRGVGVDPSPSAAPESVVPSPSGEPSTAPSVEPSATPQPSPSTPAIDPDAVILEVTSICDVTPPVIMPAIIVTGDGRVVWRAMAEDGLGTEYRVRTLSADGLAELHDRLRSTSLFDESARYEVESLPDVEPPGMGGCLQTFVYRADADADPVVVESGAWYGDELEEQYFVPSPERRTLNELLTGLGDPEAMLGEGVWADERATFAPDRYLVIAAPTVPELATEGAPDVDDLTWPFDQGPDAFGEGVTSGAGAGRCGIADADRVRTLADELAAAGLDQFAGDLMGVGATLPWASQGTALDVAIWPVIVEGAPACDDVQ